MRKCKLFQAKPLTAIFTASALALVISPVLPNKDADYYFYDDNLTKIERTEENNILYFDDSSKIEISNETLKNSDLKLGYNTYKLENGKKINVVVEDRITPAQTSLSLGMSGLALFAFGVINNAYSKKDLNRQYDSEVTYGKRKKY